MHHTLTSPSQIRIAIYRSCPQLLNIPYDILYKNFKITERPVDLFFLEFKARNAETNHTQVFKNWKMYSSLLSIKIHIQNP